MHMAVTGTPFKSELEPDAMVIAAMFTVIVIILQSDHGIGFVHGEIAGQGRGNPVALREFRIFDTFQVAVAYPARCSL